MTLRPRKNKVLILAAGAEVVQQEVNRAEAATQPVLPLFSFQDADHLYLDPFPSIEHFSFVSNVQSLRAPSANRINTPTLGNLFDQIQCFRSNNRESCGLQSAFTPDISRGAVAVTQEDPGREIQDFEEGFIFFKKKHTLQKSSLKKLPPKSTHSRGLEHEQRITDRCNASVICQCKASTCKGKHCGEASNKTPKKQLTAKSPSCTCKKSGCQNNYCPCHQARIKCSEACYCGTCHNDKSKSRHSQAQSNALMCNSAIRKGPVQREPLHLFEASHLMKRKPADVNRTLVVSQLTFAPS